jgi:hypothetical protein
MIVVQQAYWDSPKAKKLFLGNVSDNCNVVEVLQQQRIEHINRSIEQLMDGETL